MSADVASAWLGLGCFQETGSNCPDSHSLPAHGPGRGAGIFATFLKTCGILHVIILCLNPEHFVSGFLLEHVILFPAKTADFPSGRGEFLMFEECISIPLTESLPLILNLVFTAPTRERFTSLVMS